MNQILTEDEIDFLVSQRLTPADVIDARGLSSAEARKRAKEAGAILIVASPCEKAGHRLRTYRRHCAQCNTRVIAEMQRSMATGYVYVAGSQAKKLIKVGCTGAVAKRAESLRQIEYGRVDDWQMLYSAQVPIMATVEGKIIQLLKSYAVPTPYLKEARKQRASEMFNCSYSTAYSALSKAFNELSITPNKVTISPSTTRFEWL